MISHSRVYYLGFLALLIIVGLIVYVVKVKSAPSPYDGFAQCLTDQGVVMYGAYWCPHCQNQKKEFGNAFRYVTYVECAQPGNPRQMTETCRQVGIEGYPTWRRSDGQMIAGEQSLGQLAEFSGCELEK